MNSICKSCGMASVDTCFIKNWNQISAEALGTLTCKPEFFRNRVRKAIINGVKCKE